MNPVPAFPHTRCDECDSELDEGEDVYLCDGQRYCEKCAEKNDNVCECGNFKKEEFETCYECR